MADTLHVIINSVQGQSSLIKIASDTIVSKVINATPTTNNFKWADYLKPSIDLLIALVGAFVLVWKYLTQKQKEFEERIIDNKRAAYAEFLTDFTETAIKVMHDIETGGIEDDKKRMAARNQLLLYANDKVLELIMTG